MALDVLGGEERVTQQFLICFVPISEVALETIDGFNPQFPRRVAPGSICANY